MAAPTVLPVSCAHPVVQAPMAGGVAGPGLAAAVGEAGALRKAAVRAGDPQGMALWAGQGHRLARELPAGQLVEALATELSLARKGMTARGAS